MNTLPKKERLNSKIKIEKLFKSKNSFIQNEFKVYWDVLPSEDTNISVLISVPKKNVHLATNRNKIKRIIRECYRINKNILIENKQDLTIAIVYLSSEIPEFRLLEEKIKLVLQRLNQELWKKYFHFFF